MPETGSEKVSRSHSWLCIVMIIGCQILVMFVSDEFTRCPDGSLCLIQPEEFTLD